MNYLWLFLIYLQYLIIEGVDVSMRKDITVEKIMRGGEKMNKSALARQYECCWRTIDRRLNPNKYKTYSKKEFIHPSLMNIKL